MDSKLEALVMAQQAFVERMNYNDIAQLHGVSVATVSRRLAEAKESGFVREIRRVLPPNDLREALYRYVTFDKIGRRLREALNQRGAGLKRVIVTAGDTNPAEESSEDEERKKGFPRITRVGIHGARLLQQELKVLLTTQNCVRIGVNWGYAVQMVCTQFGECDDEALLDCPPERIEFNALSGLFWIDCDPDIERARRSWVSSSAVNAQRLVQAFRHQEDMRVHLIRVPAIIGKEMFESERRRLDMTREVLQNFCKSDPGYRYLYGDKPIFPTTAQAEAYLSERWLRRGTDPGQFGTILEQDFLLTGLSSLDKTAGFVHLSDLALDKQVEYFRERFHASGDVASHIFTEDSKIPRLDHPAHPEIGAENARVLSLWPEDLTQCADLHRATPGGVIVLSCGQKKAHALLIALTGLQIANYVVIDTNLAWKLYEHMGMINEQERDFSTVELWDFSVNGSNGQENG